MTKAIIFDLDSCLSPAYEPGQQLFAPAFDAITNANRGSHSASVLQNAFADMWRLPFDFVAEEYRFTPAMKTAGWEVLTHRLDAGWSGDGADRLWGMPGFDITDNATARSPGAGCNCQLSVVRRA